MRQLLFYCILIIVSFSSCEIKVENGTEKVAEANSKIKNGIVVKSNGLKVVQAFLLFEDGTRVPEGNVVQVNQKVNLRLFVTGWKDIKGKVAISGGETIETSEGQEFLKTDDLFKEYKEGIDVKDAEYLSFSAVITKLDKLYDYFKVSFYLKDKNVPGNFIEGYYKLHIN